MFRHHKLGSEGAGVEHVSTALPGDESPDGVQAEGVVLSWKDSHEEHKRILQVGVAFDDGEVVEFEAHVSDYLHLSAEVRAQLGLAHDDDLIVLGLVDGAKVPVRYDPADRRQVVVDEAALHQRELQRHIASQHDEGVRAQERRRGL